MFTPRKTLHFAGKYRILLVFSFISQFTHKTHYKLPSICIYLSLKQSMLGEKKFPGLITQDTRAAVIQAIREDTQAIQNKYFQKFCQLRYTLLQDGGSTDRMAKGLQVLSKKLRHQLNSQRYELIARNKAREIEQQQWEQSEEFKNMQYLEKILKKGEERQRLKQKEAQKAENASQVVPSENTQQLKKELNQVQQTQNTVEFKAKTETQQVKKPVEKPASENSQPTNTFFTTKATNQQMFQIIPPRTPPVNEPIFISGVQNKQADNKMSYLQKKNKSLSGNIFNKPQRVEQASFPFKSVFSSKTESKSPIPQADAKPSENSKQQQPKEGVGVISQQKTLNSFISSHKKTKPVTPLGQIDHAQQKSPASKIFSNNSSQKTNLFALKPATLQSPFSNLKPPQNLFGSSLFGSNAPKVPNIFTNPNSNTNDTKSKLFPVNLPKQPTIFQTGDKAAGSQILPIGGGVSEILAQNRGSSILEDEQILDQLQSNASQKPQQAQKSQELDIVKTSMNSSPTLFKQG